MAISPVTQQAIDNYAKTVKTQQEIATAVLAKQFNADKQQGQAAVKLIEQAANGARGIDVTA